MNERLDQIRERAAHVEELATINRGVVTVYKSQRDITPLLAAVQAVFSLHWTTVSGACAYCPLPAPCPTVQAVTSAFEASEQASTYSDENGGAV